MFLHKEDIQSGDVFNYVAHFVFRLRLNFYLAVVAAKTCCTHTCSAGGKKPGRLLQKTSHSCFFISSVLVDLRTTTLILKTELCIYGR